MIDWVLLEAYNERSSVLMMEQKMYIMEGLRMRKNLIKKRQVTMPVLGGMLWHTDLPLNKSKIPYT